MHRFESGARHLLAVIIGWGFCAATVGIAGEVSNFAGFPKPGLEPEIFAPSEVSTDAYEFSLTFAPQMDRMYFTRRQDPGPNRIMEAVLDDGGVRGVRAATFCRSGAMEACVAPGGERIYFQQDQTMQVCARTETGWSEPRDLPEEINGIWSMAIWADRAENLYFTSGDGLVVARRTADGYEKAVPVGPHFARAAGDAAHGYFAPDLEYAVFDSQGRSGGKGRADLYVTFNDGAGNWSQPANLDVLNTEGTDMCPSVSPDGRFLFFCRDGDIYWVDAKVLESYRPGASGQGS